ncbi:hypothetical protein R1flu_029037 [Riccia fluitans]|uniref:Uncharacterized protein n=1 Tax=Riccia fluitans TaxID=41844 RepID=A0ABD1XND5_9MARC
MFVLPPAVACKFEVGSDQRARLLSSVVHSLRFRGSWFWINVVRGIGRKRKEWCVKIPMGGPLPGHPFFTDCFLLSSFEIRWNSGTVSFLARVAADRHVVISEMNINLRRPFRIDISRINVLIFSGANWISNDSSSS